MAPAASLVVRVSAQIAEFQKSFNDATKVVQKFSDNFEGSATRASAIGNTISRVGTDMAYAFGRAFAGMVKDAIRFSQEFNNAFIGLSSVARAFGTDTQLATNAARQLSSDGLLPLKDSATGLKNLLAAGFGLDQSVDLMNAFKDAAAFGRAGALSFGDAVRTATEGVKNGNSILVDNAGITKNLSQILKEAGYSQQDLSRASSDAGVRQALYNGILREAAAFQGDAAKAANTYTGQLSALDTAWKTLLSTWGDAITQNQTVATAMGAVSAALRGMTDGAASNKQAFNFISDAIIGFMGVLAGLVKAINFVQKEFNLLDSAIKGAVQGIAGSISTVGGTLLELVRLAAKLPGGSAAIGFAASEIISLMDVTDKAGRLARQMGEDIRANNQRMENWNETLTGAANKITSLATELGRTRGQVVSFGDKGGPALERVGTAAKEAGTGSNTFAKSLKNLTTQIEAAQREGTPLSEMMDLFGSAASKAERKAKAWGISVKNSVADVARAFNQARFEDAFDRIRLPNISDMSDDIGGVVKSGGTSSTWLDAIRAQYIGLPGVFGELNARVAELGNDLAEKHFKKLQVGMKETTDYIVSNIRPMRSAFSEFGQSLPEIVFGALKNGGNVIGAIGAALGAQFSKRFQNALAAAGGDLSKVSSSNKLIGLAGSSIGTAITGFQLGQQYGKGKGALAGAAAGAAAGTAIMPGFGTAIGAGVGALAGFFGGRSADKKAKQQMEEQKIALQEQFGGMEKLRALADKLGVNIQAAFDAKKPEQFKAAVDRLNGAIDLQNKRIEGLGNALEGVNARAQTFGENLNLATASSQPEFERLGLLIGGVFAGLVKESGDAFDAITKLKPAFEVLRSGIEDFGLGSNQVIDELLANFALVNDTAFRPLLENVRNTGQVLEGLFKAQALSPAVFQAAASDIGQSLQAIADKGGDISAALALSQPVLQKLWEYQETFGSITDDTTLKILEQAKQQGLVGAQMKGVNDKILDVLLAIAKVLKADLPAAFDGLKKPAEDAAANIEDAFSDINPPEIRIRYRYDQQGNDPDFDGPRLASGGIVRRPTVALIGERGPEAVIPLGRDGLGMGDQTIHVNSYLDGELVAKNTLKRIPGILRGVGV
jgi:hypothetical protein